MTNAVTDASFENDVLKAEGPVLVDFWAEWCGPCRMIGPTLEDLSKDMEGQLKVVKVNIDQNPVTPSKYGVRSIPTLIVFENGKIKANKMGASPKGELYAWVNSVLQQATA